MLAGALIHTVWAIDLAEEDTPRETRSEIETSVPHASIQTDGELGKQGGSNGCQNTEKKLLPPSFSPHSFPYVFVLSVCQSL